MTSPPVIFISAVTKELKSARQLVANALEFLEFKPEWQDIFGSETGNLTKMLEEKLDGCVACIQLVGQAHGTEMPRADEPDDCLSYTQYEAKYARQKKLRVWYLVLANDYPPDEPIKEEDRLRDLQIGYRARLASSASLHHPIRNRTDLELAVLKMVKVLDKLRPVPDRWVRDGEASPAVPAAPPPAPPDFRQDLREVFNEFLPKLQEARQGVSGTAETAREDTAYARLAAEHGLPEELLRHELTALAERIKKDKQEPLLERARAAYATRDFTAAEDLALRAAEQAEKARPPATGDLIAALLQAALAAEDRIAYDQALQHLRRAERHTDREADPVNWASVQHRIAYVLDDQGKHREVAAVLRQLIPVREAVLGLEHPDTLASRMNLANALDSLGKHAAAAREHRAVLALQERVLGPKHPDTLRSRNNLACALDSQGKHAASEGAYRAVLALQERVLGPEHPDTLMSRMNLANALFSQGKHAAAEVEYRAVLALQERALGPEHPDTLVSCYNLTLALQAQARAFP